MPSLFEIRARAGSRDTTRVDVVQVELDSEGRRLRPIVIMSGAQLSLAISLIVDWTTSPDCSGWLSFRVLEGWLGSWGSRVYFKEVGVDWDPQEAAYAGFPSTNPLDKKLQGAVEALGTRLAHQAVPIAVAQVIEAYLLASEFDALVVYLASIDARTVAVMT
jgi:hypothetical protein